MDANLVNTRKQVIKNITTLIKYRNSSNYNYWEYYKQKLKAGKSFVVEIINGKIEFAPSKFVGYKDNSKRIHDELYNVSRTGVETDKALEIIYGKRIQSDDFLDKVLNSFYNLHSINGTSDKPKAQVHYFISVATYDKIKEIEWSTPKFFTQSDIVKYSKYAGKPYRKNNPKHIKIGKEIRENLYDKTIYWLNSISVPGYVKESKPIWQIGGHFSKYTWGRILKEKDKSKLIYFTVGIDFPMRALIYKLDCQRKRPAGGNKLTKEQIIKFDNFVERPGPGWMQIDIAEINNLDWEELTKRTNRFIRQNEKLYDDVIKYVWGSKKIKQPRNTLEEVEPPEQSSLPKLKPTFKGKKIDFAKRLKKNKQDGKYGELLVIEYEKKRLGNKLKEGMEIKHISKDEGDGTGYDVKSYDVNGNEIFIEVKTTKSSDKSIPFNITLTELEFSKKMKKSYWLYRVYDFDRKNNSGKLYKINGNLYNRLDLRAESFLAVFKGSDR